jgi:hypothetical protein
MNPNLDNDVLTNPKRDLKFIQTYFSNTLSSTALVAVAGVSRRLACLTVIGGRSRMCSSHQSSFATTTPIGRDVRSSPPTLA